MKPKDRIVLLQKQLSIATKALKEITNLDTYSQVTTAEIALEDIERVRFVQEGREAVTRQPTPGVYENYREPGEFGEGVTVRRATKQNPERLARRRKAARRCMERKRAT